MGWSSLFQHLGFITSELNLPHGTGCILNEYLAQTERGSQTEALLMKTFDSVSLTEAERSGGPRVLERITLLFNFCLKLQVQGLCISAGLSFYIKKKNMAG